MSFWINERDSLFFPILACKVLMNETEVTTVKKNIWKNTSELNWAEVGAKLKLLPKTVEYASQQRFMCWKDPHRKSLNPRTPGLNQQQQLVRGFIWSNSNHKIPTTYSTHKYSLYFSIENIKHLQLSESYKQPKLDFT